MSLPGRAYAFSENGNCLVQILKGPTNILGTYFIVNYATTLDFANKQIKLQTNSLAPAGVGICTGDSCATAPDYTPPDPSDDPTDDDQSTDDGGLSGGAIAGIILGGLVVLALIVAGVMYAMKKNKETTSVREAAFA